MISQMALRQYKHEWICRTIGAQRFSGVLGKDYTYDFFSNIAIHGTMMISAFFNYRGLHFFLSLGNYLSAEWVMFLAICAAFFIAFALRNDSFEQAKSFFLANPQRPRLPSLGESLSMGLRRIFSPLGLMMVLGIFGAGLFIFGQTEKDEVEVANAEVRIDELQGKLNRLDADHERKAQGYEADIQFYQSIERIKYGVVPVRAKMEKADSIYWSERGKIEKQIETARGQKAEFRPSKLLSAVIDGNMWLRIAVAFLVGIIISLGGCDLVQYRLIWVGFSRLYDELMVETEMEDIYNKYIISENAPNATGESYTDATPMQHYEDEEYQGIDGEDVANSLTPLQQKILEIKERMENNGGLNISKMANELKVYRSTIYRNFEKMGIELEEN